MSALGDHRRPVAPANAADQPVVIVVVQTTVMQRKRSVSVGPVVTAIGQERFVGAPASQRSFDAANDLNPAACRPMGTLDEQNLASKLVDHRLLPFPRPLVAIETQFRLQLAYKILRYRERPFSDGNATQRKVALFFRNDYLVRIYLIARTRSERLC